jgi:two-component system LytT family response regulator
MIRAYLVDDEPLALRRLERMLRETRRVEILGMATDPVKAREEIEALRPDVLFLDIQMPEMTGFELAARLQEQPLVVFCTAFDEYALRAFEVNSIDYLLKPVEAAQLDRALGKVERLAGAAGARPAFDKLLEQVQAALRPRAEAVEKIAAKVGDKVHLIPLESITHFYAEDKLTYAATAEKSWMIDKTIAELEARLDPRRFVRVHRGTVVNLEYVDELYPWFGGKMMLRLKGAKRVEIGVARERVKELKERLGVD